MQPLIMGRQLPSARFTRALKLTDGWPSAVSVELQPLVPGRQEPAGIVLGEFHAPFLLAWPTGCS